MKHDDATMLIMFSQGFSAVWKKMGCFPPTYLSVQLIALEAKLKTLIRLEQYIEICSLHCSVEKTLLETSGCPDQTVLSFTQYLLHITVLRFRKKNPY